MIYSLLVKIQIKRSISLLVIPLVCTYLLGCQSTASLPPSRLDDGPHIQSVEPDVMQRYDAFYIPDIAVYSVEDDVLRRVSSREVQDLADKLRTKLIHQIDDKYTMFSQPAKNVAMIRIALTDVSTTYTVFQLLPGVVFPNAMRGGASIEAKVVDSITGKEVLTFRDTRQGKREGYFSGLGKWDGVEKAFDEWAFELDSAIKK